MASLLQAYRDAWAGAGHARRGKVMLAFHMYCAESAAEAAAVARVPLNQYLKSIVDAASGWMSGVSSRDYPNYQKMIEGLSRETFESQVDKGLAWIGTPQEIRRAIDDYHRSVGGFECASLQVNFGMIGRAVGPLDGSTWRRYRLVTERGVEPPFFMEPDNPDDWPGKRPDADRVIRYWNIDSRMVFHRFNGHEGAVRCLAGTP